MKQLIWCLAAGAILSTTVRAAGRAASTTDPPIGFFQAPSSYTRSASGRTALTDAGAPVPYIPLVPCRQYDSRSATPLADNTPRTVTLSGAPCGIPTGAAAVALNITVFNIVSNSGNAVFKIGTVAPPTTAWINYGATETQRANAGVATLSAGTIVVQVNQGAGSVDFVVDVFGYYASTPASTSSYFLVDVPFIYAGWFESTAASGAYGAIGRAVSGTNGIGTFGRGSGYGVFGSYSINTAIGVYGESVDNIGVEGISLNYNGVWAWSTNQDGLFASGGRDGIFSQGARYGVYGTTTGTGVVDGIVGTLQGAAAGSSGVHAIGNGVAGTYGIRGQQGAAIPVVFGLGALGGYFTTSSSVGALGLAAIRGMQGSTVNTTTGAFLNSGVIGYTGTSGVHSFSDITAGGVKSFVEPHPTDPGRQIVYIAMEGPEAGTYFRGRGRFVGKTAVIDVPESFRLVTEEEGLTVQITPIGRAAAVGVTSMDLNQIVVESTRDVEFSYLVQGVRHHRGQFEAIQQNTYFVPSSADARMDPWPPEIQKQLVNLGIYSSDGKVNMQTAEKMGWAQKWRDDEAKEKAAQEAAAAQAKAAATRSAPQPLAHSGTMP